MQQLVSLKRHSFSERRPGALKGKEQAGRMGLCLLLLLSSQGHAKQAAAPIQRTKFNFNPGWQVRVGEVPGAEAAAFDDAKWKPVTLPYAWNEDEAFKKDIKDLSTGVAWYRKHFRLPAGAAGQKVFIEFEGVQQVGEFYLNGQALGRHENGVMAVGFDLTPYLRPAPQDNVLAVRTDNDWDYQEKATGQVYQWSNRNFNANYGGIPKHVYVHVMSPLHQTIPLFSALGTTGVYVYAQGFDVAGGTATVVAQAQVKNEFATARTFTFEAAVADGAGKNIIGHWNYAPGVVKNVDVVSNGEKVELFLNGKSLGFGQRSYHFLFTFKGIAWQPGTLRAVSYDATGRQTSAAEHQTAGPAVALRLTPTTSPAGLHADGTDLALVQVEAVDAQGHRCPTALNTVDFTLNGPAAWRGGLAQGPDNYILAKRLPVEGGVNRVLIRTTTQAGKITLTATAEGLKSATVSLQSQPVAVRDGLATRLPGTDLPVSLLRGPTPAGPSFTAASRVAVPIAGVAANSNAANAALSYDDNELSEWISDRQEAKPWIEYTLARSASISEVTMKLTGWRTSTYPIRLLVEGQEVFHGVTEPSLGYYTATFAPHTGQKIRIELAGTTQAKDAFNITELEAPKVPTAATDQPGPRGTLGLVEVEFYEKAAGAPAP